MEITQRHFEGVYGRQGDTTFAMDIELIDGRERRPDSQAGTTMGGVEEPPDHPEVRVGRG
jgi:hypothetical protein